MTEPVSEWVLDLEAWEEQARASERARVAVAEQQEKTRAALEQTAPGRPGPGEPCAAPRIR